MTIALPAFVLALTFAGRPLQAGEPSMEPPAAAAAGSETGQELYTEHCAVCHGADGRGHGPLAEALKTAPADLAAIRARHNDEYPAAKVADIIRTGGGVLGHGTLDMPAWGIHFSEKHKPAIAKARIEALVGYVRGLQSP